MPSFDIVSRTDIQEVDNAVNSVKREIAARYDFKGSSASIELKGEEITINGDDDYKLEAIQGMLKGHLAKRQIEPTALEFKTPEKASGNTLRQLVKVKQGIEQEVAKSIVKHIKDSKMKVQASIKGDELRVTGNKRDDLQAAIALVRGMNVQVPLQYINFRD
ncbi:MAG: YajQ family cyclic di-GMP-binding protein [Proteobacteria bacterium]|nr:YajQ family cyclic di-GMP-binding protein [Pseudomonadota bacterium]